MKYELRKLSFGETLGTAFNLYFDNFVPLFVISLVCNFPSLLFLHTSGIGGMGNPPMNKALAGLILVIINLGTSTLCTALIIELISKKYLKQHQGLGQYFQNVLPFIFPILGLTIMELIIIGLGFLAFIIPGIFLALALSVAAQALIVEGQTVMGSISRSFFLTKEKKLEIFGFGLIFFLIFYVIGIILQQFKTMIVQMGFSFQTRYVLIYGIDHLVNILIMPISSCIFILVYFNLRIEKEGFDLEHLVDQFGTGPGR
jgi:hypothetical protein